MNAAPPSSVPRLARHRRHPSESSHIPSPPTVMQARRRWNRCVRVAHSPAAPRSNGLPTVAEVLDPELDARMHGVGGRRGHPDAPEGHTRDETGKPCASCFLRHVSSPRAAMAMNPPTMAMMPTPESTRHGRCRPATWRSPCRDRSLWQAARQLRIEPRRWLRTGGARCRRLRVRGRPRGCRRMSAAMLSEDADADVAPVPPARPRPSCDPNRGSGATGPRLMSAPAPAFPMSLTSYSRGSILPP